MKRILVTGGNKGIGEYQGGAHSSGQDIFDESRYQFPDPLENKKYHKLKKRIT